MLPQVIDIGGFTLATYTVLLSVSVLVIITALVLAAPPGARRPALDIALLALALALVLGRAEHVALRWSAYSTQVEQALTLGGGYGWHGVVLGALLGVRLGEDVVRRGLMRGGRAGPAQPVVPRAVLALALPLLAIASWMGCRAAGCAYGREVWSLADYAAHVTAELPDVYGLYAPRWNTSLYGIAWCAGVLAIAAGLLVLRKTARQPMMAFWAGLALLALGMYGIGFARGDAVWMLGSLRADQVLDAITCIAALSALIIQRRAGAADA